MNPLHLILMILAIVCFVLAAFGISPPRGDLKAAGLAFWALATMLTMLVFIVSFAGNVIPAGDLWQMT